MSTTEAEVVQPEPQKTRRRQSGGPLPGTLVEVAEKDLAIAAPSNDAQMLQSLMTEAIRAGNRELMREIMEIRRELKAEAAKEAFNQALSAFQSECPIIKRKKAVYDIDRQTRQRKGIRYHYAPMDDIVAMVGDPLTKNGLSYTIKTRVDIREGIEWLVAECTVKHTLGHSEMTPFEIPLMFNDFMNKQQSFGSASTFAKRYAFTNALGILTSDEDGDARGLTPTEAREAKARQRVSQPRQTPTAQKAERANGEPKRDLVPAGPEDPAIDEQLAKGIWLAMQYATLSMDDFTKRFPKIERLGQIRKGDEQIVMSWIADPTRN